MLSVILPTYNRFEIVEETLQKIVTLETNIPFEIIVVNDGQELPFNMQHEKLSIYKNPKKGASAARNFGASKAKYDIFFFIDDDMWISVESIEAIAQLYQQHFFDKQCVNLNWQYPKSLCDKMRNEKIGRYLLHANYHTLEGRSKIKLDSTSSLVPVTSMGSGSFAIGKSVFESIGKYNENILFQGEDIELSKKLNEANIPIFLYTPITCFHNQKDRLDINEFLDRDRRGYVSQFENKKNETKHSRLKQIIYTCFIPFNFLFKKLFDILPNRAAFDIITFKTIGILSSIVYFKAWYQSSKNHK